MNWQRRTELRAIPAVRRHSHRRVANSEAIEPSASMGV